MAFILINHGLSNLRPEGGWQRNTATILRSQGHQVFYPQYPNTESPTYSQWLELLRAELDILLETKRMMGDGEVIVIAHSLACVTFLKAALEGDLGDHKIVDRLLLVAPADPELLDPAPSFKLRLDDTNLLPALKAVVGQTTVVGGDDDPWTPRGLQRTFGDPLGVDAVVIPGAKHITFGEGWGPWAGLIDWVTNPSADLSKR